MSRTKPPKKSSQARTRKPRVSKAVVAGSAALVLGSGSLAAVNIISSNSPVPVDDNNVVAFVQDENSPLATDLLAELKIKPAATREGYARSEFYNGWPSLNNCNLRQRIIRRDFSGGAVLAEDNCTVISGEFIEPYSGERRIYATRDGISAGIQIDHIVSLSDAWQKGAQSFTAETRHEIAVDPINLLAVDTTINQQKSDGDAAAWLPPNVEFRCEYVARQIYIKHYYKLWVTREEHNAMQSVLETCPSQRTWTR